nr:hypothetical protein [Candidatus Sigynarchaeota archaeon]
MTIDFFSLHSNLSWLDAIAGKIKSVYLDKLYHDGVYNEIHCDYKKSFLGKRKLISSAFVGIWGWNSWCGIHTFPVITGGELASIYKRTVDAGFARTEPSIGLLPHAVVHENGVFGSRTEFKCSGGAHGEGYNLDNMLCWAKMAMEYFLTTNDPWFTVEKFTIITHTVDYMLDYFRGKYDPVLVEAGIEGDWTECTDWELDNADVNANMIETLRLAIECQALLGKPGTGKDYKAVRDQMIAAFNKPVQQGGFWDPAARHYIHGNDGRGDIVHGDKYFEATANYFALLWHIAPIENRKQLWKYINEHRKPIEMPYPVLTNYLPRTGARRKNYGSTVTNGDVWMVLGAHAAAARLQDGFIPEGTAMYKAIVDYEASEGVLHNCIYPKRNTVNDSWDPEIANYGALWAPLVLGVLGIVPRAAGLEFNITGLEGLASLGMTFFFDGYLHRLLASWTNGKFTSSEISREGVLVGKTSAGRFLLARGDPSCIKDVP